MSRFDLKRVVGRLAMMVSGEAMQSAFHLALNVALLRVLPAQEYGVFALVLVIGGLGLSYIRSLTALPASVSIGKSQRDGSSDAYEVTFGSVAVLLSVVMMLAVAAALTGWVERGAWAGAAFVGLWSLRSHLRTVFFARARRSMVMISDAVFTASGTALAAIVLIEGRDILELILTAMALANALGIAAMLALARRPIRISFRMPTRRRYAGMRHQLGWSFASVTTTNIQGQGMALLVAAIAGPAAYAPIAAALVLFVPLRIVNTAFSNMIHAEMTGMIGRSDQNRIAVLARTWPLILGGFCVGYAICLETVLYYFKFQDFCQTRVWLIHLLAWATYTLPMLYSVPRIMMEAKSSFRTIAWLSAASAAACLIAVWLILQTVRPTWSLAGGAASELIIFIGSWVIVSSSLKSRPA